jgi:hypothetical protein
MKYIITESKLENFITNYIEDLFSVDEINWANPRMYDPEEMESYEDPNLIEYYIGDYEEGDNIFFRWYGCDYFSSNAQSNCPLVVVEVEYERQLNLLFNNKWKEPFKDWFTSSFNLPVKYVE